MDTDWEAAFRVANKNAAKQCICMLLREEFITDSKILSSSKYTEKF